MHEPTPQDAAMEKWLGNLLRIGVLTAASVVILGGAVYLARHGGQIRDLHTFRSEPADLRALPGILGDVAGFRGQGIIQLGFVLLIATPVLRVIACCMIFAWQRDRLYVAVALIVLGALMYGLFGGS
jgi:uncharacterized membrane protein